MRDQRQNKTTDKGQLSKTIQDKTKETAERQ